MERRQVEEVINYARKIQEITGKKVTLTIRVPAMIDYDPDLSRRRGYPVDRIVRKYHRAMNSISLDNLCLTDTGLEHLTANEYEIGFNEKLRFIDYPRISAIDINSIRIVNRVIEVVGTTSYAIYIEENGEEREIQPYIIEASNRSHRRRQIAKNERSRARIVSGYRDR